MNCSGRRCLQTKYFNSVKVMINPDARDNLNTMGIDMKHIITTVRILKGAVCS